MHLPAKIGDYTVPRLMMVLSEHLIDFVKRNESKKCGRWINVQVCRMTIETY